MDEHSEPISPWSSAWKSYFMDTVLFSKHSYQLFKVRTEVAKTSRQTGHWWKFFTSFISPWNSNYPNLQWIQYKQTPLRIPNKKHKNLELYQSNIIQAIFGGFHTILFKHVDLCLPSTGVVLMLHSIRSWTEATVRNLLSWWFWCGLAPMSCTCSYF